MKIFTKIYAFSSLTGCQFPKVGGPADNPIHLKSWGTPNPYPMVVAPSAYLTTDIIFCVNVTNMIQNTI